MAEDAKAQDSGERPERAHFETATGWHSRIRYEFVLPLTAGKRVLDIACGNGFGTVRLAERAAAAVGVDASSAAVARARIECARPNITYSHVSSGSLPFDDGSFDVIACLETLEHVPVRLQPTFLAELRRVLAPEGVLVLSTPDRDAERSFELGIGGWNPWHLHTPDQGEIVELVRAFGRRREFRQYDFSSVLVTSRLTHLRPELVPSTTRGRRPIAIVHACSQSDSALDSLGDTSAGFRVEPRLDEVDRVLDSRPQRLRWSTNLPEQLLRAFSGAPGARPGTAAWWETQAVHRFARAFALDRRVLTLADPDGFGAASLAEVAASVVSVWNGAGVDIARRAHEASNLLFASSVPDEEFDLIVAGTRRQQAPSFDAAVGKLSRDGVIFSAAELPGTASSGCPIYVANVVATVILPTSGATATIPGVEEMMLPPAAPDLLAYSKSAERVAEVAAASPVAVARSDFQWDALAAEIFGAANTHDLAGFDHDDVIDALSLRLASLEKRIADLHGQVAQTHENRPLVSVRRVIRRIRNLLD